MIPKIIHYCWFGKKELPENFKKFISGWKEKMPEWAFMLWDDSKLEEFMGDSQFLKDAIASQKMAFVSDYVRLAAVLKYGGVYLDTDIEVRRPLNRFLSDKVFFDFIVDSSLSISLFGAETNSPEVKSWLSFMEAEHRRTGTFEANNHWLTRFFLLSHPSFLLNGQEQIVGDGIHIYPKHFFDSEKPFFITDGGYAVHYCAGSWLDNPAKQSRIKQFFSKISPFFIRKIHNWKSHERQASVYPYYSEYLRHTKRTKR